MTRPEQKKWQDQSSEQFLLWDYFQAKADWSVDMPERHIFKPPLILHCPEDNASCLGWDRNITHALALTEDDNEMLKQSK